MFILTCVDYGETCDGHARFLGLFKTKELAQEMVSADFRSQKEFYGEGCFIDESKNEIWASREEVGFVGCVYDIFEVDETNIPH